MTHRQRIGRWIVIGWAAALVVMVFSVAAAQEATLTPSHFVSDFHWQAFPVDLYCDYLDGLSEGPTWGEITIGNSSANDLKSYIETIGYYDVTQYADFMYFERMPNALDESGIPPLIEACLDIDTQTVTALRVSINRPMLIQDMVAQYGIPDIVTWGNSNIARAAFWFDEGIAALVYILEKDDNLDFGEIGLVVYFPYQTVDNFEERWPYNRTNSENPMGGDRVYDPPLSEVQNPFDFEAMIATLTAEPSRTPTPTFAPRTTVTATTLP